MASFPFQIEFIDPAGRYVVARQVSGGAFTLLPGARLGDVPVAALTIPRASSPDGGKRTDIFGFKIEEPGAATRLRVGQTVELRADEAPISTLH